MTAKLWPIVVAEGLSVRATEAAVRAANNYVESPGQTQKSSSKPSHIKELEENLLRLFGTPVNVKERGGTGTMTVHFKTKGDFKRIIDVMDRMMQEVRKNDE